MIYEEYIDALMNNPMNYKMNIMHVKNHDLHSTSPTKTSLWPVGTERYVLNDWIICND